ncbi:helix-turn-helix domain-containing protein [Actinoplanes sp. ATCC 53533]|uniref:AlbA family DNA-binding domain-containing protein n=1 Tax=Actinoplanes sp. ATCC 53533 TaxID=1288362 RepID=UPI0013155E72|nr:ATP-binding protein [Actinoplanes sp. ATCC 53533]
MTTSRPGWEPESYAEAIDDITNGRVFEHHYLELKTEYKPNQNEEMRGDIAALANDSGVLIVGVEEDKATRKAVQLRPIALAGFIERVENATRTLDPPLHVECHELVDPDDETRGIVFIRVSASALAPHQANKRYYGRDECSTYRLADAQVEALIRRRTARVDHIAASLSKPDVFETLTQTGRFAVMAYPTANHNDELLAAYQTPADYYRWLDEQAEKATAAAGRLATASHTFGNWNPASLGPSAIERWPAGVGRVFQPRTGGEGTRGYLVVHEAGAVRFAVDNLVQQEWDIRPAREAFDWMTMWTASVWTVCMVRQVCRAAGLTDTGVDIGIRVDAIDGAIPDTARVEQDTFRRMGLRDHVVAWKGGTYQRTAHVSAAEARKDLTGMVRTLFGQLMRSTGLGTVVP